jgi:hypothetical protein
MWNQVSAIVWAQWRSTRNHLPRANLGGLLFTSVLTAVWYGAFTYLAGSREFCYPVPAESYRSFHGKAPKTPSTTGGIRDIRRTEAT